MSIKYVHFGEKLEKFVAGRDHFGETVDCATAGCARSSCMASNAANAAYCCPVCRQSNGREHSADCTRVWDQFVARAIPDDTLTPPCGVCGTMFLHAADSVKHLMEHTEKARR